MAEYLIQDTTMIGIGDKIRVVTGTEGAMTPAEMQADLDIFKSDVDAELSSQDALIAELQLILANKAASTFTVFDDGAGNVTISASGINSAYSDGNVIIE